MLVLLYGIVIISFTFLKNRRYNWLFYAIFLCLLLWSSNGTYTDFDGYNYIFKIINDSGENLVGSTLGWFLLCLFFGKIGLNYYGMNLILAFVSCLLLHGLFSKFDTNENIIWSILLVFPLLINGIQIRFFFTMSIVIYCLKFLFFNSKFAYIKFFVGVLIAASIHSAASIFIICLLALFYENHSSKMNIIVTIFICCIVFCGVLLVPIIGKIVLLPSQYARYISNSYTKSSVKWFFAILLTWIVTLILFKLLTPYTIRHSFKDKKYDIVYKRIFRVLCLLGLTLPLLIFDRNYHRYIQMGYILDALCLGMYWKQAGINIQNLRNSKWLILLFYFVALIPAIYSFEFVPVNATAPLFRIEGFPSIFK